jgi:hypothetical protein
MIAYRFPALALAATLSLAAAAAHAQAPTAQRATEATGGSTWAPGWQLRREMGETARMKALHDVLNIRPDQEGAFQAFVTAMQPTGPGPGSEDRHSDRQDMAGMTTPERMDAMGRRMEERITRMRERFQRHSAAVKALYAALNPDQKRTMDALPGLREDGMGWGRRGRMDKPGMDRRGMDRPGMGMDHPGA